LPLSISANLPAARFTGPAPGATGPTHAGQPYWHGQSRISAAAEARTGIDSGKVKFEALAGPGFLGMGMRY